MDLVDNESEHKKQIHEKIVTNSHLYHIVNNEIFIYSICIKKE